MQCNRIRARSLAATLPGAVVAALLLLTPAAAQELRAGPGGEPPLLIPRLDGPIVLDGQLDEAAWQQAVVLTGVQHLPDFGAEPTQHTEFLLGHDGEYLYLGCRAYETDPSQIRITTLARDVSGYATDSCGLRLDTYNDEENSVLFLTTPASVRTDWAFANDATGPPNQDWNAFWDAEGSLTDYGWGAEIRIPFSSLGFQVEDGRVVMGFAVARTIVRNSESIVHPAIPPNWGGSSFAKPSQMRKMILTGVQPQRPVYVTPYGLTGGGHNHALNGPRDAYLRDTDRVMEVGADLRYGLTRNLNLDLSLNTDFAQVEADNQQVNLTRFSLFFPEQRRFFQERAAIFEFPLGNNERLFHSRRIGLVEGEPVRIYGGGRLVGRVGEWDLGLINMQTAATDMPALGATGLPSENMGVLRLRRRVLNQFSYMGGILTSRLGADGSYNVLYGNDAVVRLRGQDYLTLNWAQSFDAFGDRPRPGRPADQEGFFDRSLLRVNLQRRGTDGFTYRGDVARAGAIFEPGMGFLRRRDYLNASGAVGYGWRPGPGAALNRYALTLDGSVFRRNQDDSVESASYGLSGTLDSRVGHGISADLTRTYEDLIRPFALSPAVRVPPGSYWFTEGGISYSPPSGGLFRPSVGVSGGQFYDGGRVSANLSPTWSVNRHLSLGGNYQINHIEFEDRDQTFTSHVARLRTAVTFTTRTSASAFVQYNSTGDLVVGNFRFRYNPREGTDLYLVWNESMNSDRYGLEPVAPLSQARTILLKYSHTLTVGL
jgi:hypothetical protein